MTHLGPHLAPLVPPEEGDDSEDGLGLIGPVKDPFDIEDFTAASDWERLTAAIEDAIREWGLHGGHEDRQDANDPHSDKRGWVWRQDKAKVITFLGFEFQLTHHRLVEPEDEGKKSSQAVKEDKAESDTEEPDKLVIGEEAEDDGFCRAHPLPPPLAEMMRYGSDFPAGSHPIHYFFGFSHFLLLSPRGRDELDTSSRARVSLSAAAVAASDTSCSVPIFVQVMAKNKAQFGGLFFSPHFRTEFEMAVLPERVAVADCHHLQDLLRLFRERLCRPLRVDIPFNWCYASVRKTYLLEDWGGSYEWSQAPPDIDQFASFGASELARLPLGATADPIKRLVLNADWPRVNESMVNENDVHSDFDPRDAPKWSVGVTLDNHPTNLLGTNNMICRRCVTTGQQGFFWSF